MRFSKSIFAIFSCFCLVLISACGSGGGGGSSSGTGTSGTGTLSASLIDSAGSYEAVYVTVEALQVHLGGNEKNDKNWHTIPMEKNTINLCELTNGVREELGLTELKAGHYTQMRLMLSATPEEDEINIMSIEHPVANYVVIKNYVTNELTNSSTDELTWEELKVPSGFQTGIKLVKKFEIFEDQITEIILDFDAQRSVVQAGYSGNWHLKPTIKVLEESEGWILTGIVKDEGENGIPDATVSVQEYDDGANDPKNKVMIRTATLTDSEIDTAGSYEIFVAPGNYNVVAYKGPVIKGNFTEQDIFGPDCIEIQTDAAPEDLDQIFMLSNPQDGLGTVTGLITIPNNGDVLQYATLSFRKRADCFDSSGTTVIEVVSINVENGGTYTVYLPDGEEYTLVASTAGETTQPYTINFATDDTVNQDIDFNDIAD
jgi:hypothetical protein